MQSSLLLYFPELYCKNFRLDFMGREKVLLQSDNSLYDVQISKLYSYSKKYL